MMKQEDMKEMESTIFKVAKMKAEFDLLKRAIVRSLTLDYSGEDLMFSSDKMIIEVMRIIEPAMIADILECEKEMKAQEKLNEIRAKEMSKEEKEKFTQEIAEAIGATVIKEEENNG